MDPKRPAGLGLSFSPGRGVGSPYEGAGALMSHANDIIARTPNKFGQTLAGIASGLKGLGSGIKEGQDETNQAGLRRVLAGGDYNAPSVWDKIGATFAHAADGTLGEHANDRTAIRSTPMDRNPQNITIGANGRLGYDPGAGAKAQLDAARLRQLQDDNARAAAADAAAKRPPVQLKDGKPVGPNSSGDGKEPLPNKGPNPTNEPDSTKLIPGDKSLYPGSNMSVAANGQIPVPTAPVTPGPVDPNTMTATASSPLSEGATASAAVPGQFDYTQTATNPAAVNAAVTPGGDFNYSGQSPLSSSAMMGPGDVYNAYDSMGGFNDSGGLAASFGPAPFQFNDPNTSSYDSSQGLYAGSDYGSGSPLSDTTQPVPVDTSGGAVDPSAGMYG